MEQSAYSALYTGTYIVVFITALTVTLYLFNSIVNYADLAYEFDEKVVDNSVIVNQPYGENQLLTASEVASYYFNYVSNDVSGGQELTKDFKVNIYNSTDTNEGYLLEYKDRVNQTYYSFEEVIEKLGKDTKYIMKVTKKDGDGKLYCIIRQATQAELKAIGEE